MRRDARSQTATDGGDEGELADLDAQVEGGERQGNVGWGGRPIWLRAPAKPKPCSSPKPKAITQG